MIEFACIYCRKQVAVEDALATQQIQCPTCAHPIRVPRQTVPRLAEPAQTEPKDAPAGPPQWEDMSNKDIARLLLSKRRPAEDRSQEAMRLATAPLVPKYDDLTLFTLSATFLLLVLLLRNSPSEWKVEVDETLLVRVGLSSLQPLSGLIAIAGVGMAASFFGVFFRWEKPVLLKYAMLCFAVLITGGTGIVAGYLALKTAHNWQMVFPAWNIANGAILLLMFRAGLVGPECITDEHASVGQVLLTIVCIAIIVTVCHYLLHYHWAITYSICICYTMTINDTLTRLLAPPRTTDS
jgi:DNA-directed RNA polymerase subunit RPC12/RpoP